MRPGFGTAPVIEPERFEAQVERDAVQIIALRAPMADDLRDVVDYIVSETEHGVTL